MNFYFPFKKASFNFGPKSGQIVKTTNEENLRFGITKAQQIEMDT